jgi:CDP-glucose 4,6-dehydratase
MDDLKIFKGKKVFLTGHTGFKGSWMLLVLNKLGAIVKGYALEPETSIDLYHQIKGDNFCDSTIADIRNLRELNNQVLAFEPDFIFHFAAQPLVRKSYELPYYTYEVNVTGTINLLETLRNLNKKCTCIVVTTDKVYENKENGSAYAETDSLGGHDPYSASKAAAEIVVQSYRLSFFPAEKFMEHRKSLCTARAGNVIGGGDFATNRIIPDFVKAMMKNEPLLVRNPDAVRPWQHVLEPLSGYLLLAAKCYQEPGSFEGAYNFGPEENDLLTVKELAEECFKTWQSGTLRIAKLANQPHEANLLNLSIKKAKEKLHWSPRYESREAIKLTIEWYKDMNTQALAKCKQQIDNYFNLNS